nr:hypothetical protein [Priestia megaterium]
MKFYFGVKQRSESESKEWLKEIQVSVMEAIKIIFK